MPFGIVCVFLFDLLRWFEAIGILIWKIVSCGKPWCRKISTNESSFIRAKRISTLFSKSMCQV